MWVEDIGVGLETETRIPGYLAIGLEALQLSTDHSTSIEEEVQRIRREHLDDDQCVVNDRVKGRLTVTRAFGAGYLKQDHTVQALERICDTQMVAQPRARLLAAALAITVAALQQTTEHADTKERPLLRFGLGTRGRQGAAAAVAHLFGCSAGSFSSLALS
uniref:protein-serine/threonine phosphatase n=1 Tax=Zea mays TaxID=4577 RepID=A0A804QZY6_MAIZE